MLYLIGLGLGDPSDITVKGLEILKKCDHVFLEAYTSIMTATSVEDMEKYYGKKIQIADREKVEQGCADILDLAKESEVAFLVIGDPFGATTHTDLVLRARELSVPTQIIHNASILTAVGATGLQLYSFGETISIPFWTETWRPDSYFNKIAENKGRGLHTLCLLDIKVKEPNYDAMMKSKGKVVYDPPRFMTMAQAATQLLEIIENDTKTSSTTSSVLGEGDLSVGVARLGSPSQKIIARPLKEMASLTEGEMGPPLHSLIIPGNMHPLEAEFLNQFANN